VLALVALCQPAPRCVVPPYACPMIAQANGLPFYCPTPSPVCGTGIAYANAGVVKGGPPVHADTGSAVAKPGALNAPAPTPTPAR